MLTVSSAFVSFSGLDGGRVAH
eukprot:COSAG06_NODE_43842_length_368_cov_1.115242_1_plen_21_part_10